VLVLLDHTFQQLRESLGYQSRDLIVLHPDVPGLDELLAKFERCHTHADDEVRYIVDGEGVFGFVLPDGSQVELLVEPGEYVNVPMGTEHWFHLTKRKRIKAIRYFVDTTGWTPEYTGTPIAMGRGEP
jgi:1,2-dihydroxy-3-keto-5-methylthiopentene dioxygenase